MRVLLVWNGPADAVERDPFVRREVPLLERLRSQGVEITVALLGDGGGVRAHLEAAGVRVELLAAGLAPTAASAPRIPRGVMALAPVIRRHDPDLVEGDQALPAIVVGLAARTGRHVRVYRRHHAGGRRRLILASRVAARLTDRTIVSCPAMRQRAAEQDHTCRERIDVASSGAIEPEPFAPADLAAARRSLSISSAARVILVVSRLRREKGLDVFLRAIDRLDSPCDVHAVVAGSGPEESVLRRMARGGRVPVHFLGHRADVGRWLAVADVIAMPSRSESFGRVTIEAMAAGRPIVASRVGGLVDAVADRETGLLVPAEDAPALGAALAAVLHDPGYGRRMGLAARRRYEALYTIEHMAASWRRAWERAVAGAPAGP